MKLPWNRMSFLAALVPILLIAGCQRTGDNTARQEGTQAAPRDTPATHAETHAPAAPAPSGATISLSVEGGEIAAYEARPEGTGPFPGVVVVHEWWGLNDQIKTVADRIARMGYVAVVPDLYHGKVTDDPEKAHELTRGLSNETALRDLKAAFARVRGTDTAARAGILGFCMGGRLALLYGVSGEPVNATVMFYGPPEVSAEQLARLSSPLLGMFGDQDDGIPVATVRAFEEALKAAGKDVEFRIYEGAGHAFMNDTRPSHRPEAANDAWSRVEAFLAKHLKS